MECLSGSTRSSPAWEMELAGAQSLQPAPRDQPTILSCGQLGTWQIRVQEKSLWLLWGGQGFETEEQESFRRWWSKSWLESWGA